VGSAFPRTYKSQVWKGNLYRLHLDFAHDDIDLVNLPPGISFGLMLAARYFFNYKATKLRNRLPEDVDLASFDLDEVLGCIEETFCDKSWDIENENTDDLRETEVCFWSL